MSDVHGTRRAIRTIWRELWFDLQLNNFTVANHCLNNCASCFVDRNALELFRAESNLFRQPGNEIFVPEFPLLLSRRTPGIAHKFFNVRA